MPFSKTKDIFRQSRLPEWQANILPLSAPDHPDLRIERAEDNGVDVTEINCRAYGFSQETAHASLLQTSFSGKAHSLMWPLPETVQWRRRLWLPSATAFILRCRNCAEKQGNGYGHAVVRHALQKAYEATGLTRTILHATQAGCSLYERLGYRPAAHFTCYAPRPTR